MYDIMITSLVESERVLQQTRQHERSIAGAPALRSLLDRFRIRNTERAGERGQLSQRMHDSHNCACCEPAR